MDLKTLVANLRRDADELEALDRLVQGIGASNARKTVKKVGSKRVLSAKARAAISRAQKERWRKVKAGKKS